MAVDFISSEVRKLGKSVILKIWEGYFESNYATNHRKSASNIIVHNDNNLFSVFSIFSKPEVSKNLRDSPGFFSPISSALHLLVCSLIMLTDRKKSQIFFQSFHIL